MDQLRPTNTLSYELIQQMPKVDLHAHLSGSISQEKLNALLERRSKKKFNVFECLQDFESASLASKKCFDYFDAVYEVVTDLESLEECTDSVLESFAHENCVYLELRTEPKPFKIGNSTAEQYVEVLQKCIRRLNTPIHRMDVKLCLSIKRDNSHTVSVKMVVAKLEKMFNISKKYEDFVVGIDICGNPAHNTIIEKIIPALCLCEAYFKMLPITFHIGETDNDDEIDAIIENIKRLNIRRLGHAIHLKDNHIDKLNSICKTGYSLGIEMCPTSNLVTSQCKKMKNHHFGKWWKKSCAELLISVNTDDRGLFSCSLSAELYTLATCFGLTLEDVCTIQKQAVMSSFASNKDELIQKIDLFYSDYKN